MSYLLSLPLFEPRSFWPAAYVVFVPWLVGLCLARRSRGVYVGSLALGLAFWLTHCRWLQPVSLPVYLAGCLILAFGFLGVAWLIRRLHVRYGLALTVVFPVAWTVYELFHSRGLLNTPWCLLAHSQVRFTPVIQIADLAGVLGVTFLVAMVNGWIADQVLTRLKPQAPRAEGKLRLGACTAAVVVVLLGTLLYGYVRLNAPPGRPGPRVAVVQGDFPLQPGLDNNARVIEDPLPIDDELDRLIREDKEAFNADKRLVYLRLLGQAAAARPDLIVLPETPWNMVLNREYRESPLNIERPKARLQHEEFARLAREHDATIVVGGLSQVLRPPGFYPAMREYNSAFVYGPSEAEPRRYDKVDLVFFGEYLPFRYSSRLHRLFRLLNDASWNPWGAGGKEYVTTPGSQYTTFAMHAPSRDGETFRFAAPICYEDAIGHTYRRFVVAPDGGKRVDFMLNISNVGWFGHRNQQAQHLAACTFRAVENRVWIARASNTGISGFIDVHGRWHDLVNGADDVPRPGGMGYRVAEAQVDPRVTVYSRYGDVLAWCCVAAVGLAVALVAGDALRTAIRRRRDSAT